jgi:hypothetical protein
MSKKDKPIGDVARAIINLSLNLAESQVKNRVQDETLLKGVNTALPLIREIVTELNDDNPNNAEQIKETLLAWTNGPLADYLESILEELVSKIDKPNEKALVQLFGYHVIQILRLMTDLEPNNVEQIRAYWKDEDFVMDVQGVLVSNLLLPALDKKGVSPEVRDYIHSIIDLTLDTFVLDKEY